MSLQTPWTAGIICRLDLQLPGCSAVCIAERVSVTACSGAVGEMRSAGWQRRRQRRALPRAVWLCPPRGEPALYPGGAAAAGRVYPNTRHVDRELLSSVRPY